MYIHCFLKNMNNFRENDNDQGWLFSIMNFFWGENTNYFFYNIGGYNFTLEELKHGLLRGNKKPPKSFFKILSDNEDRAQMLEK